MHSPDTPASWNQEHPPGSVLTGIPLPEYFEFSCGKLRNRFGDDAGRGFKSFIRIGNAKLTGIVSNFAPKAAGIVQSVIPEMKAEQV